MINIVVRGKFALEAGIKAAVSLLKHLFDLRALTSDHVLRLRIVLMPRWASLRASGNMESVISRNESNLLMTVYSMTVRCW